MKYSLSNIIKDLLAKIPVLENRINTLSTKITNINNNNSVVKKVSNSAPEGNTLTLVEGAIETDTFRIIVGDEGKDNLYVSFDTRDNGDEKIQFRQYKNEKDNDFRTPIRTAVILGRNGETTFPVSVTAPKFVGSLQGNATTATYADEADNADTVDGYHASDLLRTFGGNRTPVMTDIFDRAGTIDLTALSTADKANDKAKINKSRNSLQDIWNTSTGIAAYGGDVDMANGYVRGTLKLTQSYMDFDKILVVASNDAADTVFCKLWDVYELNYMFFHAYRFPVIDMGGLYWYLFGKIRTGTATNYVLSTDTIWSCGAQNCAIIAIYGIKY